MTDIETTALMATTDTEAEAAATPTPAALVIDDDELYRDLVRIMLERLGWRVDAAWNGQVGWQMAQLYDYDAVVCDIVMPGQDGFETIPLIRRRQPRARIVAMSGGGLLQSDIYGRMALGLGADVTLGKPFSLEDLCDAIGGQRCPPSLPFPTAA